jgi:hypothetical protein
MLLVLFRGRKIVKQSKKGKRTKMARNCRVQSFVGKKEATEWLDYCRIEDGDTNQPSLKTDLGDLEDGSPFPSPLVARRGWWGNHGTRGLASASIHHTP